LVLRISRSSRRRSSLKRLCSDGAQIRTHLSTGLARLDGCRRSGRSVSCTEDKASYRRRDAEAFQYTPAAQAQAPTAAEDAAPQPKQKDEERSPEGIPGVHVTGLPPPYSKEAIYYPGSKEEHVNAEDEIIQDNAACLLQHSSCTTFVPGSECCHKSPLHVECECDIGQAQYNRTVAEAQDRLAIAHLGICGALVSQDSRWKICHQGSHNVTSQRSVAHVQGWLAASLHTVRCGRTSTAACIAEA